MQLRGQLTKMDENLQTAGNSSARSCGLPWQKSRAQGCLLGQVCGDALGSEVECFADPDAIRSAFPGGVREMRGGGAFNTLAGQPTDDSEMALALARTLVRSGGFDPDEVRRAYVSWFESGPFDCGETIAAALCGHINSSSQGNGALMRASPLGLLGAGRDRDQVADWARRDAALTHPNPVCQDVNALFVLAIATSVREGSDPQALYNCARRWADKMEMSEEVREAIESAATTTWIERSGGKQAWVLVALQNALWQLLHAPNLEEGIVDTIGRGGAARTNAAVCGALLGSVYGIDAVPSRWRDAVTGCRPAAGQAGVGQPRPETYWASDVLELAQQLISA